MKWCSGLISFSWSPPSPFHAAWNGPALICISCLRVAAWTSRAGLGEGVQRTHEQRRTACVEWTVNWCGQSYVLCSACLWLRPFIHVLLQHEASEYLSFFLSFNMYWFILIRHEAGGVLADYQMCLRFLTVFKLQWWTHLFVQKLFLSLVPIVGHLKVFYSADLIQYNSGSC